MLETLSFLLKMLEILSVLQNRRSPQIACPRTWEILSALQKRRGPDIVSTRSKTTWEILSVGRVCGILTSVIHILKEQSHYLVNLNFQELWPLMFDFSIYEYDW